MSLSPGLSVFQISVARLYADAAVGQEEAAWQLGRYQRLQAQGWNLQAALEQSSHEAEIRFRGAPPEADVLRGMSLEEARSEHTRLMFRVEQLTVSLRQLVMTKQVRLNVERERDEAEREAHDLWLRIREVERQPEQVAS
jgi:hypothetical protein